MSASQKAAWFNLVIVASTAVLVPALYLAIGAKAYGGFGLLGVCGFAVLFHRRRGKVTSDERDELIQRRANAWASAILWMAFVAAVMLAPNFFGEAVPVLALQASLWVGFMILLGVQAIATLVLYHRMAGDGR